MAVLNVKVAANHPARVQSTPAEAPVRVVRKVPARHPARQARRHHVRDLRREAKKVAH